MPDKRSPPSKPTSKPTSTQQEAQDGLQAPTQEKKAMPTKVNFKSVSDSYEPRAAGEYEGTLISHKINAASAASGQPTVTLDWSENDSPNRHMFRTYSLQPKALWSLKRDLIRVGADVDEMNDEDADLDEIIIGLYGYVSTLVYGDPRPGKDKEGNDRLFDNMIEVKKPGD